jgi:hypothetical protein
VARAFLVGRHAVLHTCSGGLSSALRSRFTVVGSAGLRNGTFSAAISDG